MSALAENESIAGQTPETSIACAGHRAEQRRAPSPGDQGKAQREEIRAYQRLAEETLSKRAAAIDLYHELRAKLDKQEPFSGEDLLRLNQGATAMLEQREALLKISHKHECWLDDAIPDDPELARVRSAGIAMSLSAALLLYDNYLSAISLYRRTSPAAISIVTTSPLTASHQHHHQGVRQTRHHRPADRQVQGLCSLSTSCTPCR